MTRHKKAAGVPGGSTAWYQGGLRAKPLKYGGDGDILYTFRNSNFTLDFAVSKISKKFCNFTVFVNLLILYFYSVILQWNFWFCWLWSSFENEVLGIELYLTFESNWLTHVLVLVFGPVISSLFCHKQILCGW